MVAKWLGFKNPNFVGRSEIRGYSDFKGSHGFESVFTKILGEGVQSGFIPCDDTTVYWFFTYTSSNHGKHVAFLCYISCDIQITHLDYIHEMKKKSAL